MGFLSLDLMNITWLQTKKKNACCSCWLLLDASRKVPVQVESWSFFKREQWHKLERQPTQWRGKNITLWLLFIIHCVKTDTVALIIILHFFLFVCVQTWSAEGSEDDGLRVSFHLLRHLAGVSPTGQLSSLPRKRMIQLFLYCLFGFF